MFNKYRAWDKNQKVFVYDGDLWHPQYYRGDVHPAKVTNLGILWTNKLLNTYYVTYKNKCFYPNWEALELYDRNIILERSTDLPDINGKKIYEGDKVRVGECNDGLWLDSTEHTVVWGKNWYPAFHLSPSLECEVNDFCYVGDYGIWDIEVIGNIHEGRQK